jgi:hypothetical protein
MADKEEVYVSVDIEADGPIPGPYSMLSLGAAAFSRDGTMVGTFSANLDALPGAGQDPDTMRWWGGQKEAWEACRKDLQDPKKAMGEFVGWVKGLRGIPVFVGYPAGFDFTFVYWYIVYFGHESPFSFSALDIKTYAMALLKTPYRGTVKKKMPRRWFTGCSKHKHLALLDAIEQGEIFIAMLNENLGAKDGTAPEKGT